MQPSFSLLQSEWWSRVRERQGWQRLGDRTNGPVVLQRSVGPVRFAYAPHAFHGESSAEPIGSYVDRLRRIAADRESEAPHLIRWDVPWESAAFDAAVAESAGLRRAPVRVQPPNTVVVDLSPEEEEIMAAMKGKTRYNVRLAAKKGVTVARFSGAAAPAEVPRWYRLYQETARRDQIAIHPLHYYQDVVETAVSMRAAGEPAPVVTLYMATHEDDLLSGILVTSYQGVSTYLYGAGANMKRNLMASYLIQWEAMRDAKAARDIAYDMFGIPPSDDPSHPMHGLYRFKTGFGGAVINRPGCWDVVQARVVGGAFRAAERARQWYHHDLKKRFRR
ncbi:MAG: peptidoglycan bridge formation glycyltransferase FemA/FemB family protein [Alkalispirochaeta sp.]